MTKEKILKLFKASACTILSKDYKPYDININSVFNDKYVEFKCKGDESISIELYLRLDQIWVI